MKKLWFKAKNYGYGWYPATWQGWLILLIFIAAITGNYLRIEATSRSTNDTLMNFIPETIVMVLLLIYICTLTGEKPEWRWGKPSDQHKK